MWHQLTHKTDATFFQNSLRCRAPTDAVGPFRIRVLISSHVRVFYCYATANTENEPGNSWMYESVSFFHPCIHPIVTRNGRGCHFFINPKKLKSHGNTIKKFCYYKFINTCTQIYYVRWFIYSLFSRRLPNNLAGNLNPWLQFVSAANRKLFIWFYTKRLDC